MIFSLLDSHNFKGIVNFFHLLFLLFFSIHIVICLGMVGKMEIRICF